ncbi:MAG: hypothetical protein KAS94_07505 [Desulfobulbaceae bacterium]|nr:hypothetical protein [Desulfobulbaceae bacterium]
MKYQLSFCEVEQLSDNIFEVTINHGTEIDKECAQEALIFWHELRKEPYGLLVNSKNSFSYSFRGAQKIGAYPLERKTAALINDNISMVQMSLVLDMKKMAGYVGNIKVFHDREEAIAWLETIN